MEGTGLQRRLLIILAAAALAVTVGSAVALLAMVDIGREFDAVTRSELPETTAALRIARIGERIQSRAPALVAAFDADERAEQARLIDADLATLTGELAALTPLRNRSADSVATISETIDALEDNLRSIATFLARNDELERARAGILDQILMQEDQARQILGPSILAVQDVVRAGTNPPDQSQGAVGEGRADPMDVWAASVLAQGPLLDAERLIGSLTGGFFVAAEADTRPMVTALRERSRRQLVRLRSVIETMPNGLRPGMAALTARFEEVLDADDGLFAIRDQELEVLSAAERLLAENRALTNRLSEDVDRLVSAADASIREASGRVQDTIVGHSAGFVLFSLAAVVVAVSLSYFFVIRDVGQNLRRVTVAMSRLAAGERDTEVPAMHRRDEIGDLARAFDVFRDNAFRIDRLNHQLAEKSSLLVATFDNMNDGFTVFDEAGRLVAWNPQYLRLYDLPWELVSVGHPLAELLCWVERRGAQAFSARGEAVAVTSLGRERRSQSQRFEIHMGEGRIVELRSNPVPSGGFVTIHTDVTEQKATESQLRQAQKMEVVGQLTGGLAHDFNNIISVILGNLLVLDEALIEQPALRDRAIRALSAAERAGQQIERLLAVSRRQKLNPETVDVNGLVDGMLDLLEASVGPDVTLAADLADDLPPVFVDPGQLENSLLNLVINARDAQTDGGLMTIGTRLDDAVPGSASQSVAIAVTDTGPGIPPEIVERVFEPFFTTKAAGKGSGLGLSMVYGFVTQSGGDVRIDSRPDRGTTVTLVLPAAMPSGRDSRIAGSGQKAPPQLADRPTGPILVVEDEPDIREQTVETLRNLGFQVLSAPHGAAAVDLLRDGQRPCLLYSDVFLGQGDDGFALAQRLRRLLPGLPVLLASGGPMDRLSGLDSYTSDETVLPKPVDAATLAQAVRRALGWPDAPGQAPSTAASKI